MSEPITFEQAGISYRLMIEGTTVNARGVPTGTSIVFRSATPADLIAAGYVPKAERDALAAKVAELRSVLSELLHLANIGHWDGGEEILERAEAVLASDLGDAVKRVEALEELWEAVKDLYFAPMDGRSAARKQAVVRHAPAFKGP